MGGVVDGQVKQISAVLLDTTGIQQYVFSSNKLKINLGASYNVKNIFDKILIDVARQIKVTLDLKTWETWESKPDTISIKKNDVVMEVGYIGGGNALLFFNESKTARKFVQEWTVQLMIVTPGLKTAVAIIDNIDVTTLDSDRQFLPELFSQLGSNKYNYNPIITIPGHGITAECQYSGFSAVNNYIKVDDKSLKYFSSVASSKWKNAANAVEMFEKEFEEELKGEIDTYKFPKEIDKLGQEEGDSHIAIVHIDGNSIGKRFRSCRNIVELRKLSCHIRNVTRKAMGELISTIVGEYDSFYKTKFKELADKTLPIRPIILGGDDVTFVCDGRLGVFFAEIFLKSFTKQKTGGETLSACAGITITKTKYPFYRGYKLAEELCRSAKNKAKDKDEEGSSWLDFHIAYGGFSGELSVIRQNHYMVNAGSLCLRPYRVVRSEAQLVDNEWDFDNCKNGIASLLGKNDKISWPKNKLAEFREIITIGVSAKKFISEMAARNLTLPVIKSITTYEEVWQDQQTPYFDMLELADFYKDILDINLDKEKVEDETNDD